MSTKQRFLKFFALILIVMLNNACSESTDPQSTELCPQQSNEDGLMYLKGSFNGWGNSTPFVCQEENKWVAEIDATPGNYGFKIALKDWSTEWVINTDSSEILEFNTTYPLTARKSPEDFLFVTKSTRFRFELRQEQSQWLLNVSELQETTLEQADPHKDADSKITETFVNFDGSEEQVAFSTSDDNAWLRDYVQSTTLSLRDPGPQHVSYSELKEQPKVRSGNLKFDALFALAVNEMKYLSVSHIQDSNYNNGAEIACDCFKTGEKWAYVWTRDLSYAASLTLGILDPERVKQSLLFKTSIFRDDVTVPVHYKGSPGGLQIIQDTGSGGSWPVSTDRVTWSFGAMSILNTLTGPERKAFAQHALQTLSNTIENDRLVAFDQKDGLYTGEQSFLDWREQTYQTWIVDDLASMASSKSLSTNAGHYQTLVLAATLAKEHKQTARAEKYQQWAEQLKKAINDKLWLPEAQQYSSLTAGHFDGAALHKFDWLGTALTVLTGIADEKRAQLALAHYPHGQMGAPVIFPQQPGIAVYHNRAIWPFVTAFGLRAAAQVNNSAVANEGYKTLIRGASLNLSNMENLEWLTAQPMYLERQNPRLTGPVINSNYQLWSVAAYLNMVVEQIYGVQIKESGVEFKPFITGWLRSEQLGNSDTIRLEDLKLRDQKVNIEINFPEDSVNNKQHYYPVQGIAVNGERIDGSLVSWDLLTSDIPCAGIEIKITLGKAIKGHEQITRVEALPDSKSFEVFAPFEPVIVLHNQNQLQIAPHPEQDKSDTLSYRLYRNGRLFKEALSANDTVQISDKACYSASAVADTGTMSHHSIPVCMGEKTDVFVDADSVSSNVLVSAANNTIERAHLAQWGKAKDTLSVNALNINAGQYAVQIEYHNDSNSIGQGITNGIKWITIKDSKNNILASGAVQLPHTRSRNGQKALALSTPLMFVTDGTPTSLTVEDYYNMSYLDKNTTFTAAGGLSGARNTMDITGFRFTEIDD